MCERPTVLVTSIIYTPLSQGMGNNRNIPTAMPPIQALLFDVFGTVVNWRASVVAELEALGKKYGAETGLALSLYVRVQLQTQTFSDATDWGKFAQDWWSACMKKMCVCAPAHVDSS